MTPINDLIRTFELVIEANEEKEHIRCEIPIDDAKTILDALRNAKHLSEPCECTDRTQGKKVPHFCSHDLSATVEGMVSSDYKERFKAEYYQTKIRYERLKSFNTKIKAAIVTECERNKSPMPLHACPNELLREQQRKMGEYLHILELRAVIEDVDLTSI